MEDEPFCRICLDTTNDFGTLIRPCGCDGTMKYVHQYCLNYVDSDINIENRHCTICQVQYNLKPNIFHHWNKTPFLFKNFLVTSIICICISYINVDYLHSHRDDFYNLLITWIVPCVCNRYSLITLIIIFGYAVYKHRQNREMFAKYVTLIFIILDVIYNWFFLVFIMNNIIGHYVRFLLTTFSINCVMYLVKNINKQFLMFKNTITLYEYQPICKQNHKQKYNYKSKNKNKNKKNKNKNKNENK